MNKRVTVCFPFVGGAIGGSHLSAIKLIKGLDARRFKTLVVLHEDQGPVADQLRAAGIEFETLSGVGLLSAADSGSSTSKLRYGVRTLPRLVKFLRRFKVDILHTNDGVIHANWGMAAKFTRAKHLWHHRADPEAKGINLLAPFLADQIVTVSNFSKPNRPLFSVEHKTRVIHSPFDHPERLPDRDSSRMDLVQELDCHPDTRFVGIFGELIERKKPVALVEIINVLKKRHPELRIVGLLFGVPSPYGPRLDEAVRLRAQELGVSDRVHLMGFRQPIEPLMCGCDILLVPAINEPFGRTLIEAMLLGTPVVATDHGGNPEAIKNEENGFLVQPDDPKAFVEPIRKLMDDANCWTRISKTAQKQAMDRFSVEIHVRDIVSIYEQLAGKKA